MKVSAVLSTLVVAGLVSAAPPGAHPTDLQQPPVPQAPVDVHLPHNDKRDDPPPHDSQLPPHELDDKHGKRGNVPPPKDGRAPPKPKDDNERRGDVPPPLKSGKAPPKPAHN